MNGPYFQEPSNTIDNNNGSADQNPNGQIVNSDPVVDKVPMHETPMGGTLASVGPIDGPAADMVPMFETPIQEIPMGGTLAAVGPMNEPVVDLAPAVETPIQVVPMGGTVTAVEPVTETIVPEALPIEPVPYKVPEGATLVNESLVREPAPYKAPVNEIVTRETPASTNAGSSATLLNREESELFRTRWNEIQGKFVDEPRTAVQQADVLLMDVIKHMVEVFSSEHSSLEAQWKQGNDVSTEDLRKALQHYRSFFNRLVV